MVTDPQPNEARQGHRSSAGAAEVEQPRSQLTDLHRARILAAAARTLDERGYAGMTAAQVIATAGVARSRFYELFGNCDACVAALLDELVALIGSELRQRRVTELPWDERMREALWVALCCLEQHQVLARACILRSVGAGGAAAERREEVIAKLVDAVDAGRGLAPESERPSAMTAEGVVAAAIRLVYSRLAYREGDLTSLLGELTGLILLPYLGAEQTRAIQRRPLPDFVEARAGTGLGETLTTSPGASDPLKGISMRLTLRTTLALEAVAANPGASNKTVADRAGITDQGQASKLLSRLERLGLIANQAVTATKWELNSWTLTPAGRRVVRLFPVRPADVPAEPAPRPALVSGEGA